MTPGEPAARTARRDRRRALRNRGLTLIELLLVVAIIGTLGTMVGVASVRYLREAKVDKAIADIRALEADIDVYRADMGSLPEDLGDIIRGSDVDPWGRRYEFFPYQGAGWKGKARKDKFLVPINTTYDLYSKGPDGESQGPLAAKASRDDIVRAADGAFVGIAEEY